MARFKVGDTIGAIIPRAGLDECTVIKIENDKYYCKIMNGIVILPIGTTDNNYTILHKK